jgi:histone H2B
MSGRGETELLANHWLARLSAEVNVDCLSGLIFGELRGITLLTLQSLIRDALTFTDHERRRNVTAHAVLRAATMHLDKFSKKNICEPRALAYFIMNAFTEVLPLPNIASEAKVAAELALPALIQGEQRGRTSVNEGAAEVAPRVAFGGGSSRSENSNFQDKAPTAPAPAPRLPAPLAPIVVPAVAPVHGAGGAGTGAGVKGTRCLHWMESTCYNPEQQIYMVLKQVHPHLEIRESGMAVAVSYTKFLCHAIIVSAIELAQHSAQIQYDVAPEWLEKFAKGGGDVVNITARTIQTAVRLVIAGELSKHAVSEGTKAVKKYTASPLGLALCKDRSAAAGLQFDVNAVERAIFDLACGGAEASSSCERLEYRCVSTRPSMVQTMQYEGRRDTAIRVVSTAEGSSSTVKTVVVSECAPVYLTAVLEYVPTTHSCFFIL